MRRWHLQMTHQERRETSWLLLPLVVTISESLDLPIHLLPCALHGVYLRRRGLNISQPFSLAGAPSASFPSCSTRLLLVQSESLARGIRLDGLVASTPKINFELRNWITPSFSYGAAPGNNVTSAHFELAYVVLVSSWWTVPARLTHTGNICKLFYPQLRVEDSLRDRGPLLSFEMPTFPHLWHKENSNFYFSFWE